MVCIALHICTRAARAPRETERAGARRPQLNRVIHEVRLRGAGALRARAAQEAEARAREEAAAAREERDLALDAAARLGGEAARLGGEAEALEASRRLEVVVGWLRREGSTASLL